MSAEGTPTETPGHKALTARQKALVAAVRRHGESFRDLLDGMAGDEEFDQRFVAIARTDLQKALGTLVRAITKPDFF